MRLPPPFRFGLLLLLSGAAACGGLRERAGDVARRAQGGGPVAPVPPPPGSMGVRRSSPRLVALAMPGLPPAEVLPGVRSGALPGFRRARLQGALVACGPGALETALRDDDFLAELSRTGARLVVLRSDAPFPVGIVGARVLHAGWLPDLTGGEVAYVRLLESEGAVADAPVRRTARGGMLYERRRATGGRDGDVFWFALPGPKTPEGKPAFCAVEVRTNGPRTKVRIRTPDDGVELVAGRVSRPVIVRFEPERGDLRFGRTRFYLRPTGLEVLDLFALPLDVDPGTPPPDRALSDPPDFVERLRRLPGPLPRFARLDLAPALGDGALDVRDAVRLLAAEAETERALFERVLSDGDFDFLYAVDPTARRFAAVLAADHGPEDRVVSFFGHRVAFEKIPRAVASRLDRRVRGVLAFADARRGEGGGAALFEVSGGTEALLLAWPRTGVRTRAGATASLRAWLARFAASRSPSPSLGSW